jgi:uncharacterized protein
MSARVLTLPGIANSGPGHWQSLWEQQADPSCQRVAQRDWDRPQLEEWIAALEAAVAEAPGAVLVAHSLGCLLAVHWAQRSTLQVRGALLVAAADPEGPEFPAAAASFGPAPLLRLPFPSILVASDDDPYGSVEFAQRVATAWGSRLVRVGKAGHINADSHLGEWPEGRTLLGSLIERQS